MNLQGKTALVTGGSHGIGLATAQAFVRHGARVAVTGRDPQRLAHAQQMLGPQALVIQADAGAIGDNLRMRDTLAHTFGQLDIVFANAGVAFGGQARGCGQLAPDALMDANFDGIYFSIQSAVALMRPGGSIILNASWLNDAGMVGPTLLSVSKSVVRALTRCLSAELAARQIRVNAVSPGAIELGEDGAPQPGQPGVRMLCADGLAEAVLFLASDASRYMLGAEVVDARGFACA